MSYKALALIASEEERDEIAQALGGSGVSEWPDWLRVFTPGECRQAEGLRIEDFAATAAAREHPEYRDIAYALYNSMLLTSGGGRLGGGSESGRI